MTPLSTLSEADASRAARGSLLIALGVLTVVLAVGYSAYRLSTAQQRLVTIEGRAADQKRLADSLHRIADSLDREIAVRAHLLDSLTQAANKPPPAKAGSLDKKIPTSTSALAGEEAGQRARALKLALDLRDRNIQFKWGGKAPNEGFDSSGFVAYVLNRAGVLTNYRTYWSGALLERFQAPDVRSVEDLRPGDLLFYDSGYCAIYLGERRIIGMVYGRIQVADLNFGPSIIGFGRVPYTS